MTALVFICPCGSRFPDPLALYDHHREAHSTIAESRAARDRVRKAEYARRRRAEAKAKQPRKPPHRWSAKAQRPRPAAAGAPTPPPATPPTPPTAAEVARPFPPAVARPWLPPQPVADADLARAKARIAARHGVEPCTKCGIPKGSREANSTRPFRDRLGRCAACHESAVLRSQLRGQGVA